MARWFSEDPDYTEITAEEKAIRDKVVAIMAKWTTEMEGYAYFGSNPGIKEDDYEDVADAIMLQFQLK